MFASKYRRRVIYGKIKADIGMMLRKLCTYKGVEIIEAEAVFGRAGKIEQKKQVA